MSSGSSNSVPERIPAGSAIPQRRLSLVDCTSIIVGIIIGSGIYESTPLVAGSLTADWQLPAIWILGGLFALVGSLCYAELATRSPVEGGDYAYLSEAFGRPVGFLFAWTQLWVIRPGSIGAMACVFASYAGMLFAPDALPGSVTPPQGTTSFLLYSCGSVFVLTSINALGVRLGATTQNILTAAKVLGLAAVILAGSLSPAFAPATDIAAQQATAPELAGSQTPSWSATLNSWSFAMIFVLFAYSGWNEMGCVAAEVREPRKNILRALLLGAAVVTVIYVGINMACAHVLGLAGMAQSDAVAAKTVAPLLGAWGGRAISLLICISALGSINGMIFTGARIYYAMGSRHRGLGCLAHWHARFGTPVSSLAVQMLITLALVAACGATAEEGSGRAAFQRLVMFMTPPFYLFLMLSSVAVIVLRRRAEREGSAAADPAAAFRMPLFPWPAIGLAAASAFMLYKGAMYVAGQYGDATRWGAWWVGATLASGLAYVAVERVRR
ncbi:MAG: amino acid permease [Planctomycetia bacterium]|nr:amino acid permease [Planctomycetia bacterium]